MLLKRIKLKRRLYLVRLIVVICIISVSFWTIEITYRSRNMEHNWFVRISTTYMQHIGYVPTANTCITRLQPDTLKPLKTCRDSLQAVKYTSQLLTTHTKKSRKIGIFGDSFAENWRVNETDSVVYKLAQLYPEKYFFRNYGVDGFGTDQAYQFYLAKDKIEHFDEIWLFTYINDPIDILENRLIQLKTPRSSDEKNFQYAAPRTPSLFRRISRFSMVLQYIRRHFKKSEPSVLTLEEAKQAYIWTLRQFQHTTQKRHQKLRVFFVSRTPSWSRWNRLQNYAAQQLATDGISVLQLTSSICSDANLSNCFFKTDPHWTETGNQAVFQKIVEMLN